MRALHASVLLILALLLLPPRLVAQSTGPDDVRIGVVLPGSSFAGIADEQRKAIGLALADFGAPNPIAYADSRGSAAGAVEAFEELMAVPEPPRVIITCASWASNALHPLTATRGVFHVAIASAVLDRRVPDHTVRFTLDAAHEEKHLAHYLSQFNRIAILHMENDFGSAWAGILRERLPEKLVATVGYDPAQQDFSAELAEIKAGAPDALVLLSTGEAGRIAEQARSQGISAQLVGTRPIESRKLLDLAAYTEGLVYTYPSCNAAHPMREAYRESYGQYPTNFGMEAYDAVTSVLTALRQTDGAPGTLFDWYRDRRYSGALGEVRFDTRGDAAYPYMYKQIVDGEFRVAEFQYALLLEQARREIVDTFYGLLGEARTAARELSRTGLTGAGADAVIETLYKATPFAFDIVTVDTNGTIVNVYPMDYHDVVGKDISDQEQIVRLHAGHDPVLSEAIDTVEGIVSFDLEHPVFSADGDFTGSVSILLKPGFFRDVITQKVSNFPVEIWLMQRDGRIVYDLNEAEIGENLFTSPIYAGFEDLKAVGRRMSLLPQGAGDYEFLDQRMETSVRKRLLWSTVSFLGTEFRIALAHVTTDTPTTP